MNIPLFRAVANFREAVRSNYAASPWSSFSLKLLFCFGRERISLGAVGNPHPSRKMGDGLPSLADAPRDMQMTLDVDLFRTIFFPQQLDAHRHRIVGFDSHIQNSTGSARSWEDRSEATFLFCKTANHRFEVSEIKPRHWR